MNSSDQNSKSVGFITDRPSPSVEAEPATVLTNWRVMQVLNLDGNGRRTLHLTGSTPKTNGRVTTELVNCVSTNRQATTRSGRVYLLAGAPGDGLLAEIAITVWLLRDSINDLKYKDVTRAYLRLRRHRRGRS
jgi:hypothetical protein